MTDFLSQAESRGPNKRGYTTYVPGAFDYSCIAADLANLARAAAGRITNSQRNHLIEVGTELIAIKEKMAHGHFEEWCDRALFMTARAARNYMQVARHFGDKPEIVSVLPAASVYKLAYAPEEIRHGIVERIENGEYVDRDEVEEAIRRPKIDAAEAKRVADEQRKREARAQRRRERREQNWRAQWEAEEERERQREQQAALELVRTLAKHFDVDTIIRLNKLWSKARFNAVVDAATSFEAADPAPLQSPHDELEAAWRDAGASARSEFLSRIGQAAASS